MNALVNFRSTASEALTRTFLLSRTISNFLLRKLSTDPRLGLVGTPFREGNFVYDYRFTNIEHVSGACQLFRRECFEAIGGYRPIQAGGIDLVAVISARLHGWKTRTFTERASEHHRKTQAGKYSGPRLQYSQRVPTIT